MPLMTPDERFRIQIENAKLFKAKRITEIDVMVESQRLELARLESISEHWKTLSPAEVSEIMATEKLREENANRENSWRDQKKRNNEQDTERALRTEPLNRFMWAVFGFALGAISFCQ